MAALENGQREEGPRLLVELKRAIGEEDALRPLLESLRDGVFAVDVQGRFVFVNDFIAQSSGYPAAAFVGRSFRDLVSVEHAERVGEAFERVLAGEPVEPVDMTYQTADGTKMWVEVNFTWLEENGEVVGALCISRNIQQRKAMEDALRESEEKYRTLVETLPHGVVIVQDRKVVFANGAVARMVGVEDVRHLDLGQQMGFIAAAERSRIEGLYHQRMAGADGLPERYLTRLRRADGAEFPVEVLVGTVRYGGREASQYVLTDMTERQLLEERVRQTQKMEAIGTLAGGIAHDFNNLLTGILGMASMLRSGQTSRDQAEEAAAVIERAARRAASLTGQLLGFARRTPTEFGPVEIHSVIADVVDILRHTIDERVSVRTVFDAPLPVVRGDTGQLQQVVMNLAVNARDAMPGGGTLTVETSSIELPRDGNAVTADLAHGPYLVLSVSDTGEGIAPEVRDRIFEPFFTTKPPGAGTGMGLAVVYGIVANHNGAIEVHSEPSAGATFRVYLPVDPEGPRPSAEPEPAPPRPAGGTLLLVDDQELMRKAAGMMLRSFGYRVITAAGGEEALERYREEGDGIDLVMVDMSMPGMNGRECIEALREIDPKVKALLTSGYSFEDLDPAFFEHGRIGFIAKPYRVRELAAAVATALGR